MTFRVEPDSFAGASQAIAAAVVTRMMLTTAAATPCLRRLLTFVTLPRRCWYQASTCPPSLASIFFGQPYAAR